MYIYLKRKRISGPVAIEKARSGASRAHNSSKVSWELGIRWLPFYICFKLYSAQTKTDTPPFFE